MADKKKRRKNLKWGHTPWETMPRKQLELEMAKAYFALQNCRSTLIQHRLGHEGSPYWQPGGAGDESLSLAQEVFAPYIAAYMDPSFYDTFYKSASPLLFEIRAERNWAYCPKCRQMVKGLNKQETDTHIGQPCYFKTCEGVMEWLTWEHLRKDAA